MRVVMTAGRTFLGKLTAMLTSCHAEQTGLGIILSGIGERENAERICNLFTDCGFPAIVTPFSARGDYRVFLIGATLEEFRGVVDEIGIARKQKPEDANRSP